MPTSLEEFSVRMHVFMTPGARDIIDALKLKTGMPRAELTRRAMEFAVTHMTDRDWQTPPTMMGLERGPGNPHTRKNGHKK
jgi:hypothetical protein